MCIFDGWWSSEIVGVSALSSGSFYRMQIGILKIIASVCQWYKMAFAVAPSGFSFFVSDRLTWYFSHQLKEAAFCTRFFCETVLPNVWFFRNAENWQSAVACGKTHLYTRLIDNALKSHVRNIGQKSMWAQYISMLHTPLKPIEAGVYFSPVFKAGIYKRASNWCKRICPYHARVW